MAAVSWSALHNDVIPLGGATGFSAGYAPVDSRSLVTESKGTSAVIDKNAYDFYAMSKQLRGSRRNAKIRAFLQAAIASGGSINAGSAVTFTNVDHVDTPTSVGALGGQRVIATNTLVAASQTVSSTDATNLQAAFAKTFAYTPSAMPSDASGNGGGGRLTASYRPG